MYEDNNGNKEMPKWNQEFEEDNNYNTQTVSNRQQKKKRKWVIPTVIIAVVVIAAIVCVAIFVPKATNSGLSQLVAAAENSTNLQGATDDNTQLSNDNGVTWVNDSTESQGTGSVVLTDVTGIVEEVYPAVVSITSRTLVNKYNNGSYSPYGGSWSDYYNYYMYGDSSSSQVEQEEVDSGAGTGTIIGQSDENLLILTSYHVVEGASSFAIGFVNGTSVDGQLQAADEDDDIAIVTVPLANIDSDTLNSIAIAKISTEEATIGEGVVVIGNALGYGMSVTQGIVSAVDRVTTLDNGDTISLIQTDAAINAGNSGGCMLNSKGEIIGISEGKIVVEGVEDMCFAIPISTYASQIQSLIDAEPVENTEETTSSVEESTDQSSSQVTSGVYLGIRGRDITSDLAETYSMPQGVYVSSVVENSGAAAAGIQQGDIIVALDNTDTTTMEALQSEIAKHKAGDKVTVTIERQSGTTYQSMNIDVTLTGN